MQNNSWSKIFGIIVLVVLVSIITVKFTAKSNVASQDSVYSKVMKSGVITACYLEYPPALIKDPNTGKLSGIFYDTLNKVASNMGLKVDWTVQVGWGDMVTAVNSGKCDIVGSPAWSNSTRGKSTEFSTPLYYSAINAYVKTNDNRFDGNPYIANDPKYTVVDEDGETSQLVVQKQFPNSKVVTIPQTDDVSEMLLNVVTNKADMAFVEPSIANLFLKTHPGALKNVSVTKPVAVYGNVYLFAKGQFEFVSSVNNAINELLGNGYVDQSIDQYGKDYPGGFYRDSVPYVVPNTK